MLRMFHRTFFLLLSNGFQLLPKLLSDKNRYHIHDLWLMNNFRWQVEDENVLIHVCFLVVWEEAQHAHGDPLKGCFQEPTTCLALEGMVSGQMVPALMELSKSPQVSELSFSLVPQYVPLIRFKFKKENMLYPIHFAGKELRLRLLRELPEPPVRTKCMTYTWAPCVTFVLCLGSILALF